jgi:GxxExxY protein
MPIVVDSPIRVFSQDEFHALAHRVLAIVFGVHNEFGRLMDEEVYKQAIRRRCEAAGIVPARREVEIRVTHGNFSKSYFMDLLFAFGLMVEAKTAESLTNKHCSQALHYLLLSEMRHGLVLNLRSSKVQWQYVSTTLDIDQRRRYRVDDSRYLSVNEASRQLRGLVVELLDDWGAFLETSLYRAAVIDSFGGPEVAVQRIGIHDHGTPLGTQETCLIADDTAFALTAMTKVKAEMQDHLQRFLAHTSLNAIQWINMDHHEIDFHTLVK